MIAFASSAARPFTGAGCFAVSAIPLVRSASDLPIRLGAFIAGLPAASAPWHAAHFALYRAAPSSAHDRLGIRMNRATAIVRTSAAILVVFMIAFPLELVSWRGESSGRKYVLPFSPPPQPYESPCSDSL